jgi:hypothetical protein
VRDTELIERASVCQNAHYLKDPAIRTLAQARELGNQDCPLMGPCNAGTLLGPGKRNCIPRMAQDVARYARKGRRSVEAEMEDFKKAPIFDGLGYIDPYDNPDPDGTITDKAEICRRVAEWAHVILGETPLPTNWLGEIDLSQVHCRNHDAYQKSCSDCRMARLVAEDRTEVVRPNGIAKRVPRGVCRCPILRVGDFCPVHGG